MNVPMLQAMVEGHQESMFELECLAVHQGYWAAYYQSKRPKPVNSILRRMIHDHEKQLKRLHPSNAPKPEVNVEEFLQREAAFNAILKGGEANGR